MKVLASVKKICRNCKIIRRNGVVRVISSGKANSLDFDRYLTWHVLQASTFRTTSMRRSR